MPDIPEFWSGLYMAQKIPLVMCVISLLAALAYQVLRKVLRA